MLLIACKATVLGLALSGVVPVSAAGDDLATVMGAGGGAACFTRAYTADHLAGHPEQNVRNMSAGIVSAATGVFELSLDVEFRGGPSRAGRILADCRPGGGYALRCLARCDGGRIEIKLRDADTIRLEIPEAVLVERGGSCDPLSVADRDGLWSDDKVFRLSRADAADCRYHNADREKPETALPDSAPSAGGRWMRSVNNLRNRGRARHLVELC